MKGSKKRNAIFLKSTRDIFRLAYDIRMSAEESDTAELMLYGEIIQNSPEWWKWSKEDKSAADFKKAVDKVIEEGATKVLLRINSPGGVCTESVAMRSILANAGFQEINIRIEGLCASAATDIATLPGAHVAIAEGSEYMIHNPWCITYGNANDIEKTVNRLRNIEQMSRGFYTRRSGQSDEQVKAWMDAETWFTAEQAVEYGFADEVLKPDVSGATPAAACVSRETLATMHSLYKSVPEQITLRDSPAAERLSGSATDNKPTEGVPDMTAPKQEEEEIMEIENITMEQIREGNPALFEQIQQDAVQSERTRLEDIDALTIPGYEDLAARAKADGTSAMDFQRQIVAAMKQRGADFLTARQRETDPARQVAGGTPQDNGETEKQKAKAFAKDVAGYAEEINRFSDGGMY